MKKSVELKQERATKIERMQAITNGAETAKRDLSPEETTEFDNLEKDCDNLDKEIERAEKFERRASQLAGSQNQKLSEFEREKKNFSYAKAIREFVRGGYDPSALTGREAEINQEYSERVTSAGIIVPSFRANENTTTTHEAILNVGLNTQLSIMGKEPLYKKMGLTMMPGLVGSVNLPYKAPSVAQEVAVGTDLANNSDDPNNILLAPARFGDSDVWNLDLLKTQNDALFQALLADMEMGCERKITAKVYTVALAAATEVTGGALTEAGLNLLIAKETSGGNWGFAMDRESFATGKVIPFTGSGSGITLLKRIQAGIGEHVDGIPAYYSELFADGAAKQYVLFCDWKQFTVGEWDGLEIIKDPYTKAKAAQVAITMNKIANIVCRNPLAAWRTPDLDSAT